MLKNIAWFIAGLFIVHQINNFIGVNGAIRIFTSIPLWFALYFIYKNYIPTRFK